MIIEKIDIKSFGALRDVTLEFSDTLNVIEGQNEAGKSTLAAFIKYMLFGFDATDSDGITEREKRINWTTGLAEGAMTVRVKEKRYLITRSTVPTTSASGKASYKEDSSIVDLETGATAFGKLPAGEVFFGVSRELFENTAFVGRIGDAAINEGSVKEAIENILFSGSERINNQRAITKIRDRMEALIHKGGQGGVIFDLVKRRDELESRLRESDEDNKQILVKETELYGIKRERLDAEDKLNKLYDLDSCYKNVMLIQTFDKLHELEEDCAAKTAAYNSFIEENTNGGYAPSDDYLNELVYARKQEAECREALSEAERTYEREKSAIGITREIESNIELADTLGGEAKVLADATALKGSTVKSLALGIGCGLAMLAALAAVALVPGMALKIAMGAICVSALAGGVFGIIRFIGKRRALESLAAKFAQDGYQNLKGKLAVIREAREKRDFIIRSTEEARIAVGSRRIAHDNARAELLRVALRWGVELEGDFQEQLNKMEARVFSYLEKKKLLLEEKNTIDLTVREIRRTLSDKNEIDIRAQVSPLKRKALSQINHDEIITGIAAFKAKIVEQDKLAESVENELALLKMRAGDPTEIKVKLDLLEKKIAALKDKHKAYFVAEKAIESASDNLRAGISPRLGEYSTELMSIMTDKKYSSFDVSTGLKVNYLAENGEEKSVDFLSGGTRDLAYISVRMALIDMLYTEKPPMCFDESFANQDNLRARSMMKSLAHLSKEGYQSFVFTCRAREAALALDLTLGAGIFKLSSMGEE